MPRFDCGGYLNIVTDERDLTQVTITLTHATAHTRYAEKPEDLPLEETPWLIDAPEVAEDYNLRTDQARDMVDSMDARMTDVMSLSINASLEQQSSIHPSLRDHPQTVESSNTQTPITDPQSNVRPPETDASLPSMMPLPSSSADIPPQTMANQLFPPTVQPSASTPDLAPGSIPASSLALAPSFAQGQSQRAGNTSGGDRVRLVQPRVVYFFSERFWFTQVHITPEEYLKYQQAYQVILNQLASSEGMDAKRYEKVGSMLKWIEQVGRIFEHEKQGTIGGT